MSTLNRRAVLRPEPDWEAAAQILIDACAHWPDRQGRLRLLERLGDELGPTLYPALIGVLCTVGERGSAAALAAVADTLVDALCSGRLPEGRRAAWGAMQMRSSCTLGPIEYLCAWHAEPNGLAVLSAAHFDQALWALLRLFSQAGTARALYCGRLHAVADDPLQVALSRGTRNGLRSLADTWSQGGTNMHAPVDAFLLGLKNT